MLVKVPAAHYAGHHKLPKNDDKFREFLLRIRDLGVSNGKRRSPRNEVTFCFETRMLRRVAGAAKSAEREEEAGFLT